MLHASSSKNLAHPFPLFCFLCVSVCVMCMCDVCVCVCDLTFILLTHFLIPPHVVRLKNLRAFKDWRCKNSHYYYLILTFSNPCIVSCAGSSKPNSWYYTQHCAKKRLCHQSTGKMNCNIASFTLILSTCWVLLFCFFVLWWSYFLLCLQTFLDAIFGRCG